MTANSLKVGKWYLPDEKSLFLKVEYSDFLIDYYLHLKENGLSPSPDEDAQLKRLLACLAIHLSLRSPNETVAWTLHMQSEQPYSLFATGNSEEQYIVGHVIKENIRQTDVNALHSQVMTKTGESRKSVVQCLNSRVTEMVETYYSQSEQLPIRLELSETADVAFGLAAMPDYEQDWFETAKISDLVELEAPRMKKMLDYEYTFRCDCSAEKLMPYFNALPDDQLNELYGSDEHLVILCPRCGRNFKLRQDEVVKSKATKH
jgi:molecular chaperone Hsp33